MNSFDQWGVELGKQLGAKVHAALLSDEEQGLQPSVNDTQFDASTQGLIDAFQAMKSKL